ncbi:unnamed protein product [Parajaminaea phylloscopi]
MATAPSTIRLPSDGDDSRSSPAVAMSQAPPRPSACERCRRRKTKCDGARPKCGSCAKANVDCIEHDANAGRRVDRSYLSFLEQRVAELEAQGSPIASNGSNAAVAAATAAAMAMGTPSHGGPGMMASSPGQGSATTEVSRYGLDQRSPSLNSTVEREQYLRNPLPPPPPPPGAMSSQGRPSPHLAHQQQHPHPHHHQQQQPHHHHQQLGQNPKPYPGATPQTSAAGRAHDTAWPSDSAPPSPRSKESEALPGDNAASNNGKKRNRASSGYDKAGSSTTRRRIDTSPDSAANHIRKAGSLSPTPPNTTESDRDHDEMEPLRNDALSCLVSVALEDQQEEISLPFSDLMPSRVSDDAARIFTAQELGALHTIRSQVRSSLRSPAIANDPTNIVLYDRWLIDRLVKRFITYLGSSLPVVHEVTAALQVGNVYAGCGSTVDHFQVIMMIAISLASITRSHRHTSDVARLGQDFYKTAHRLLGKGILTTPGVERVQCVLLMLLYSLLVPRSSNVAYLSSMAMQFAMELNLHSEQAIQRSCGRDELMADVHRRVFWTCYSIDRSLSVIIGRPTTLGDEWITTQLPLLYEDYLITTRGIGGPDGPPEGPIPVCQLKVGAQHQIRLRQLQSTIQARLYTPVKEDEPDREKRESSLAEWSWAMYDRLRDWRDEMHYPCSFVTKEWVKLQFHLTTTLLFRPSPRRSEPDLDSLHVTLHASVEALKLYKTLHRNAAINFSWMATHNLFMCGLSFLHSLRELHKQKVICPSMSFVECILQVQACASVLEALSLSEGHSGCKARDAFERVSTLIVRQLETVAFRNGGTGGLGKGGFASSPGQGSSYGAGPSDHFHHIGTGATPCRFAALTAESPPARNLVPGDRQQNLPSWSSGDVALENRHFYAHDTDSGPFQADRFASVSPHLYTMTSRTGPSLAMYQANGGRQYWTSLASQAPSRAGSPRPGTAHSQGHEQSSAEAAPLVPATPFGMTSPHTTGMDHAMSFPQANNAADALQMPFLAPDVQSWFSQPIVSQSPSDGFEAEVAYENALLQALGFSFTADAGSPFAPSLLGQHVPGGPPPPVGGEEAHGNGGGGNHKNVSAVAAGSGTATGATPSRERNSIADSERPKSPPASSLSVHFA